MRLSANTKFADEGSYPEEVFFLLSGSVLKESSLQNRLGLADTYLIEGSIFGETDLLKGRRRTESYSTVTDSYLLALPKDLFNEIMYEFDDFNEEVTNIAQEREVLRRQ